MRSPMFNRAAYCLIFSLVSLSADRGLAASCAMTAEDVRDLIRGAQEQRIVLNASTCPGAASVTQFATSIGHLRLNNILMTVSRVVESTKSDWIVLELESVSTELTVGEPTFEVLDKAKQIIGSVTLRVSEIVLTNSTVTYYDSE